MNTLLLVFSCTLVVVSAWLFWQLRTQKALLDQIQLDHQGLADAGEPDIILTLQVLDPIAVARRESKSARLLSDHLPIMVKKLVYQEVMKELQKELEDRDISVSMQLEYR